MSILGQLKHHYTQRRNIFAFISLSIWVTITKDHRLGAYKQQTFILTLLEAGKSKIKALADSMPVRDCLLDSCHFTIISYSGRGEERVTSERSGVSFIRTNPMWVLPSWPNHLPVAPPRNTITLGIKISVYEFGGGVHKHSVHCNLAKWKTKRIFKMWRMLSGRRIKDQLS